MNRWIISFTPCPFALVYSTFSNSGLVCVMSEPSSPAPRTVHVSELVVRKIADHFARQGGGGGGGVMGWVIRDPRIIWWGGEGGGFGTPRISDPRTAYHTLVLLRSSQGSASYQALFYETHSQGRFRRPKGLRPGEPPHAWMDTFALQKPTMCTTLCACRLLSFVRSLFFHYGGEFMVLWGGYSSPRTCRVATRWILPHGGGLGVVHVSQCVHFPSFSLFLAGSPESTDPETSNPSTMGGPAGCEKSTCLPHGI